MLCGTSIYRIVPNWAASEWGGRLEICVTDPHHPLWGSWRCPPCLPRTLCHTHRYTHTAEPFRMATVIILVRAKKKWWAYSLLNALHLLADYSLRILPEDVGHCYPWPTDGETKVGGSCNWSHRWSLSSLISEAVKSVSPTGFQVTKRMLCKYIARWVRLFLRIGFPSSSMRPCYLLPVLWTDPSIALGRLSLLWDTDFPVAGATHSWPLSRKIRLGFNQARAGFRGSSRIQGAGMLVF